MKPNKFVSRFLLYPASRLYGAGVSMRNMMFKCGILRQKKFDIPVIVVGNIAVGGTGKTPHAEYIISLMRKRYNVGVLSRGYGRKTRGFRMVDDESTPRTVGDEPYQMYHKYGGDKVVFAVCEDRVKGIENMLQLHPEISLFVLDDAFQHRYVKPSVAVVLMEYGRPIFDDSLLPFGRLREPAEAMDRADIVVVTKCPDDVKPLEFRMLKNNLKLFHYQKLFFSRFIYRDPVPLFSDSAAPLGALKWLEKNDTILAVCGIGNPRPFVEYLRSFGMRVKVCLFSDHHYYNARDFKTIEQRFDKLSGERKLILTTEKDAVRMLSSRDFPESLKPFIHFIPVEVNFVGLEDESFDETLNKLIRNSNVAVKK